MASAGSRTLFSKPTDDSGPIAQKARYFKDPRYINENPAAVCMCVPNGPPCSQFFQRRRWWPCSEAFWVERRKSLRPAYVLCSTHGVRYSGFSLLVVFWMVLFGLCLLMVKLRVLWVERVFCTFCQTQRLKFKEREESCRLTQKSGKKPKSSQSKTYQKSKTSRCVWHRCLRVSGSGGVNYLYAWFLLLHCILLPFSFASTLGTPCWLLTCVS